LWCLYSAYGWSCGKGLLRLAIDWVDTEVVRIEDWLSDTVRIGLCDLAVILEE
jgi:hypothetical protein